MRKKSRRKKVKMVKKREGVTYIMHTKFYVKSVFPTQMYCII